ncbi:putative aminopeptidase FrvX [Sporomusaceae bacterium BoRhaA]|uniref:M42 family metallopeptidase n=1 Tax=Pelorhabdus rhamnosifermentans TaxID=2772457 RepID=UPI001C05FEF4|nr:M42 family metallopeptidase [Pelorhabdus rhamnosifermentans]MBU2699983.1 putative aminopeptidase FrvX [Pelorhabdus rhamnosifermentans]
MDYNKKEILAYLKEILAISSPSGYTKNIMDYLIHELETLNISYFTTIKGAIIATVKGENDEYERTFSAHADTLGAMVKSIKPNGALALTLIGNYMMSCVEGENCTVETLDGKSYSGTIQTIKPSVHISGDEARELKRIPENMEIILDEKVFSNSDVEELGINVGDYICIDTRTTITEKGFIKSRYLDDKASVSILLYVLKYITQNHLKLAYTTNFYISNYEEVGHGASSCIPQKTKEFIAVDMGAPGFSQNSSEYSVCICAKDTSGPYDYELRKNLIQTCREYHIPYKTDIYPHYSSDASAILRAGWDVKTALLGPGIFASHAYERTHIDSILATIDLIINYIMK